VSDAFYAPPEGQTEDKFAREFGFQAPTQVGAEPHKLEYKNVVKEAYRTMSQEQVKAIGNAAWLKVPYWWEVLTVTNAWALTSHKVKMDNGVPKVDAERKPEDAELDRRLRRELVIVQFEPHAAVVSPNQGRKHTMWTRFWWATGEMTDEQLESVRPDGRKGTETYKGLLTATKSSVGLIEQMLKGLGRQAMLINGEKLRSLSQVNGGDWSVLAAPGVNVVKAMFKRVPAAENEREEIVRFSSVED
jgi:hypothetical protein